VPPPVAGPSPGSRARLAVLLKRAMCVAILMSVAACVPIGVRVQNMYAAAPASPAN
jgi:hypothetical protein